MFRPVRLVMVLAVLFLVAGCTSDDDPADEIHGTWLVPGDRVYEQFAEDGTWGVWNRVSLVGNPYDFGTYTFDGETLVMTSAADAGYCPGSAATFTVEFSDDGQELRETIVEDTCTADASTRGRDRVLVRQTP